MAYDANLQLANVTNISGSSQATGIDLKTGTLRGSVMWARVEVVSGDITTNTVTLSFAVEHSSDNSTWYAHTSGADQVVTFGSTGTAAVPTTDNIVWIPIVSEKRYVRLVWTKSGSGSIANGIANAYITNSHPQ